jgi:hypothetical protein
MSNPIPMRKQRGRAQLTEDAAETADGHVPTPAEIKELCRRLTPTTIEMLASIMEDPRQSAPARIACATYLIDRGVGRPALEIQSVHRSAKDMT